MNVVVSPRLRTNSAATPSPCRPSGKRLTSETFMPCASKIAPRPSSTTWCGRRAKSKAGRPAHRSHYPDDLVDLSDLVRALDRHEVHDFTDALVAKKTRHQDVAVRHVHLFVLRLVETGDAE